MLPAVFVAVGCACHCRVNIIMPEMGGYQTIEKIRQNKAWRCLPIIARTAKAMKGDRELRMCCISRRDRP